MAEPAFVPKDGQIDYTDVRYCPVINTVVVNDGAILLVQRSPELRLYPGCWNGISGFLDDHQSIEDKVYEELEQEIGISKEQVTPLEIGQVLLQEAPEYKKTWLVVPVLATVTTREFKLDWEAKTARWFRPADIKDLKLLPGFVEVLGTFSFLQ